MITRVNLAKDEDEKGSLGPVGIAAIVIFIILFVFMMVVAVYEMVTGKTINQGWNPYYHIRRIGRNNANRVNLSIRI